MRSPREPQRLRATQWLVPFRAAGIGDPTESKFGIWPSCAALFFSLLSCGAKTGLNVANIDARSLDASASDTIGDTDTRADSAPPSLRLLPLFPTGVDDARAPLSMSASDPHWQVSLSENGPFVAAATTTFPRSQRTPQISNGIRHPTGAPSNANAFYRTRIVLPPGVNPARTELEFDAGYDNWVVNETPPRLDLRSADYPYPGRFFMRVNGVWVGVQTGCSDAPFSGTAHYDTRCHVRIVGGNFQLGENQLEIWVMNFDGPYGLRIEMVETRVFP